MSVSIASYLDWEDFWAEVGWAARCQAYAMTLLADDWLAVAALVLADYRAYQAGLGGLQRAWGVVED